MSIGILLVTQAAPQDSSASPEPRVFLEVTVRGGPPGLRSFLMQQAQETWAMPEQDGGQPMPFEVLVDALSQRQLAVAIRRAGETLAERTIEVNDPVEAKLTLWLLLKSTIDRAHKRAAMAREEQPDGTVDEPENAGLVDVDDEGGDDDRAGTDVGGDETSAEAANDDLEVQSPPGSASLEPTVVEPSQAKRDERRQPPPEHPAVPSYGALVTVWLETPDLLAIGAAGSVSISWNDLFFGFALGYRVTPGPNGLVVHGVPITGSFGIEVGEEIKGSMGLSTTAELKVPSAGSNSALLIGVETGVFGQARVPLEGRLGLLLRFTLAWRLVRQRYLLDGADRPLEEHPWAFMLASGVDWR